MNPNDPVVVVALAVRRNRFERTRRINAFDPDPLLLSENELDDARAALSAIEASWRETLRKERDARLNEVRLKENAKLALKASKLIEAIAEGGMVRWKRKAEIAIAALESIDTHRDTRIAGEKLRELKNV